MLKKFITIGTLTGICAGTLVACSPGGGEYQKMMAAHMNEYKECVELGEYKGIEVTKVERTAPSDEDIEYTLNNIFESTKEYEEIAEGSKEGDQIVINATGYVDGKEFENGKLESFEYEIGSGQLIEGFDDQLVDKKVNEEFEINVTFPEDYGDETVNGKPAVFKTTITSIKRAKEATLNDEWVRANTEALKKQGYEGNTLKELKESIKAKETEKMNKYYDEQVAGEAIEQVVENSKFGSFPEKETKGYADNIVANVKKEFESYGTEYENINDFLSEAYQLENEEALQDYATEQAQEYMKTKMVVTLIAEKEGIVISDDEVKKLGDEMAAYYGYESFDKMQAEFGEEVKEDFAYQALWSKVATYISSVSNATKETESTEALTMDDLEGLNEEEISTEDEATENMTEESVSGETSTTETSSIEGE